MKLASSDVHLWSARLNRPAAPFLAALSEDERTRAERMLSESTQRRFMVARAFLRSVLGRYVLGPLTFQYGDHGKPRLAHEEGLCFNLSHSGDLAVCAVTQGREVGVDVEEIGPRDKFEQIAKRFFSERETADLLRLDEDQRLHGFFLCWTRKEALVKALGRGISFPLEDFAVSLGPNAQLLWAKPGLLGNSEWTFLDVNHFPGFAGCVVVEGGSVDVTVHSWDG